MSCVNWAGWTVAICQIDTRWGIPADPDSMHQFARELVALQPDLILSQSTPNTAALLQETRIIPIVFAIVADPVGSGFLASLARPGGNATGFVVTESSLAGKWLELLREIAPRVTGSLPCSTLQWRPMPSIGWTRSRPPLRPSVVRKESHRNGRTGGSGMTLTYRKHQSGLGPARPRKA